MKKIFSIIFFSAILVSCTAELSSPDSISSTRLHVYSPEVSKLQIMNGVASVWNKGDKVSVFYGGTINECWSYVGADKSVSGDLEYVGDLRFGSNEICAVYPYSDSITLSGKVLDGISIPSVQKFVEGSFSSTCLVAMSQDTNLQFHYAHSFVKLNVGGYGELKSVRLKSRGGESLAGRASVNVGGSLPLLELKSEESACDSIVLKNESGGALASTIGENICTFITIPPGTYTDGFELTAEDGSGHISTVYYTGKVTLAQGEYLNMNVNLISEKTITLDFTSEPFTESLPTGNFKNPDSRNDHTYYTKDTPSYVFFLHAEYDAAGYGFYRSASKGLVIGRTGAYISFPKISNTVVSRIIYEAGSNGGSPYIAATLSGDTPSDSCRVSAKGGSTEPGCSYEIVVNNEDSEKIYHLMVGGGNLCIRKLTIYYKRIK